MVRRDIQEFFIVVRRESFLDEILLSFFVQRMMYGGKQLLCGSSRLLEEAGIEVASLPKANVYTAYDGKVLGSVILSDRPRQEAAQAVKDCFFGPIKPQAPGSILQLHPDFTLVADEAALSLVKDLL